MTRQLRQFIERFRVGKCRPCWASLQRNFTHLYPVSNTPATHRSALCSCSIILLVSYELAAHAHGMQASGRASISLASRQRIVQEALAKPCRIPAVWVEVEDVSLHVEKQVSGALYVDSDVVARS
ncbi:hypothetical protein CC86DRAFT_137503 [Ophiobolus disseminans]|uniref:Uncharacterized protein n=1 Tax=Ophiobolus disseminans TaxID=1469910 RepID=A0A6A7ADR8_9PLEO|nr:hypothetical protein CC86DRAFT_137503 [Ophiobolus disseminans]